MGIFSKKKTPTRNAIVKTEGVVLEFDRKNEWWTFDFHGHDFISYGVCLHLPSKVSLQAILDTIDRVEPEMIERIKRGLVERGAQESQYSGAERTVDLTAFTERKVFEVYWSNEEWGDLGVDFEIGSDAIESESWAD